MNEIAKKEAPSNVGNPRMGWASDVAAEMLRRSGIKYIAMNPGASYRGFHDSLVNYLGNRDPQLLLCLHEDHAVSIAHGYARITGEPMGVALHSNVGLMHGLMGIFNAWCNRVPMIIIGATGPVDAPLRRPWIDWIHTNKDQGALLRDCVKWDDEPRSAEAIVESFARANQLTRSEPKAPVYICLDAGLQEDALKAEITIPDMSRHEPFDAPQASPEVVGRVAEMMLNAKYPVILPGRISRDKDDWDRRVRLAELLNAGVATDNRVGICFPTDHPLHLGIPGRTGPGSAADAIKGADVILSLDALDLGGTFRTIFGKRDAVKAKVIQVSLDSYLHTGFSMELMSLAPSDIGVLAQPDEFTRLLLVEVEKRTANKQAKWDGKTRKNPAPPVPARGTDPNAELIPSEVCLAIDEMRKQYEVTLTNLSSVWDVTCYQFRHPLDFMGGDGGAGLGSAPGSAIGAAIALEGTGRITVAVIGDGNFMQGGTALWTAAHYKIPVLYIVWNNRSNFNDEVHQLTVANHRGRPGENKWIGLRIDDPPMDIAMLARSQGVESEGPIKTAGQLKAALARAFSKVASGQPYLLDVHVDPGQGNKLASRA